MLISVFQGTFNGAHAFHGTAVQTANFIQMKGACVCRFCFRGLLRSFASFPAICLGRCKGCAFCRRSLLLFARGCACVRLHAVCGCFCAVCTAFFAFAILCPSCTLSRVYVAFLAAAFVAASFVHPPFGDSTTRRGKDG